MKNKKYYNVWTVPKYNRKSEERDKIKTLSTSIHDCSLSCLGTGTSVKCGRVKLVLWVQTSPLSKMIWSW
jgi:hypothetical protein